MVKFLSSTAASLALPSPVLDAAPSFPMTGAAARCLILLFSALYLAPSFSSGSTSHSRKSYIVLMDKGQMPSSFSHHLHWYESAVRSSAALAATSGGDMQPRIFYSYDNAFHGFAAMLTEAEAEQLEFQPGVVTILPETVYRMHTTRSPQFLGIVPESHNGHMSAALAAHDVVVGVVDTGIWPESPSFSDRGMPPVPSRWKGACEIGRGFNISNCNRKIVGARIFYRGYEAFQGVINEMAEFKSPRDEDGHGTHTASIAAGSPVTGANFMGYGNGTARGMAPRARIAVYKVCWSGGCISSDIMAAIDRAVADGVDVLSISLGGEATSYYRDALSIGAFGAMEKGIFVACAAGNGGPDPISLTNVSPWIATVGAGTMDRDFPATVRLGNGMNFTGVSLYSGRRSLSPQRQYALVYFGDNLSRPTPKSLCLNGTLDPHAVAGKIVICDRGISMRVEKGLVVKDAGGIGMILVNTDANGEELVADCHLLPAIAIGAISGKAIKHYTESTPNSTATLTFEGTKLGIRPSPMIPAFSSRGPNFLTLEIVKPDMVAPGVNILAAWSGANSPSALPFDPRRVRFNIMSGTSMSCPHIGGIAALMKGSHPEWSPAAIKSALMTTAYVLDNTQQPLKDEANGEPSTAYSHGAGHVDPPKALDPGLIYDISPDEYFEFLCSQKLTPSQLKVFSKSANRSCKYSLAGAGNLNYPAISAVMTNIQGSTLTLRRTVTNVGPPNSTYDVNISAPKGAKVVVRPAQLQFCRQNQKRSFRVIFVTKAPQPSETFGALTWSDGTRAVRSPIVATWLLPP
ncbi:Subtilisin-like protease [Apostasia shenzhenica]|uniref:Subtilisin-like protease n=1 Tax=Apostasia shenzhenica TaxID=1088818 RepID=A0A2I0AF62_9ASPA|nr:Subtilisin-like protease [Apostasia shenzhenica]